MKNIILLILALAISGCATKTGNQFLEKASSEELSKKLIQNHTTKNEVQQIFGDPLNIELVGPILGPIVEIWSYAFVRSEAKTVNFVPVVELFYRGTNDNKRALHITFNPDDRINSFKFINSDGETKSGLFQ